MHMTRHTKQDRYKRALFLKRAVPQLVHKVICHDRSYESCHSVHWNVYKKHARLLHHSSENAVHTQIQNRCILSGRSKGVYRFCKLSRIRMRELAGKGLLVGVTKASW